ncbi:MAG: hypothetical protein LBU46_03995 [Candidatus Accumulibacter sp.]|jgi:hypothetical protein|nr:hypothetical protein [Accumulibacter sp.]
MNRLWHSARFLNRRLGLALLKGFLVGMAVAMAMIISGLRAGNVEDWRYWLAEHAGLFLAWRFLLYGVIVWGWWRVRRLREPAPEAQGRWRRTEIAVATTFVLLEASQLLQRT